jgi:hypothetical protein
MVIFLTDTVFPKIVTEVALGVEVILICFTVSWLELKDEVGVRSSGSEERDENERGDCPSAHYFRGRLVDVCSEELMYAILALSDIQRHLQRHSRLFLWYAAFQFFRLIR